MTCSTEDRRLGWLLTIGGVVGLTAAVVLLVEKIALLKDPTYIPTCSINPVLSCGSVMTTPVAEAFGIPNPIIGIVGFSAVVMYGAALLAGGQFQRWLWVCLQVGVTFGVVFVHWLIYQSPRSVKNEMVSSRSRTAIPTFSKLMDMAPPEAGFLSS